MKYILSFKVGFVVFVMLMVGINMSVSAGVKDSVDVEDVVDMVKIYMMEDGGEVEEVWDEVEDVLWALSKNKINLNTATKEDLDGMMFLSDLQVENILYYRYVAKKFETIYELQLVEGLPNHVTQFMLPFVTVEAVEDSTNWKRELRYINQRLSLSSLYKHGKDMEDIEEGSIPVKAQLRYRIDVGKVITAGMTADHDAYEQFYGNGAQGFDHYKLYAEIRPKGVCVKSAVVGSFRASYGQGLLVGGMSYGTPCDELQRSTTHARGVRHYGGSDEYNYMNGAGVNMQWGKWKLSGFYSYRRHDIDTTGGTFSGIDESGYHVGEEGRIKRGTLPFHAIGTHASYIGKRWEVGMTTMYNYHKIRRERPDEPYYKYKFEGKNQYGMAVDYRWRYRQLSMWGETAINQDGGVGTVNTVSVSPSYGTSVFVNYRYYSPRYDMYYANPYSSSSGGGNEHGGTLGFSHRLRGGWTMDGYVDVWERPWVDYASKRPTLNGSVRIDARYNNWEKMTAQVYVKYQYNDLVGSGGKLVKAKGRFTWGLDKLSFTTGGMCAYNIESRKFSYVLLEEVKLELLKKKLSLVGMFAVFSAEDWDDRLYWYERNLPYAGFSEAYYGRGARWYVYGKWAAVDFMDIYLRVAQHLRVENGDVDGEMRVSMMLLFDM